MNTLTFSVFADMHYLPGYFFSRAPEKLRYIQERARKNNSAFIIHAGDLTPAPDREIDFVNSYCDFKIPSYNCLGNHDSDDTSFEDTLKAYRMPNDYYYFDCQGFRIIVLNFNYYEENGKFIPFSLGNYYSTTGSVGIMPPEEMKWFEHTLDSSPYPCILISHQSIERDADGITNAEEVRKIINRANDKQKHKVMLAINGHYHVDHLRLLDNVLYFDLNSCSIDWVEKTHDMYPPEMEKQYKSINHTFNVNEAIHAVITISDDGEIKIDGMKGSYFMGACRKTAGYKTYDDCGRAITPDVSSAHIKLL